MRRMYDTTEIAWLLPAAAACRRHRSRAARCQPAPSLPAEVIAPGNFHEVLAGTRVGGVSTMPPALYIHMPRDAGVNGLTAVEVRCGLSSGTANVAQLLERVPLDADVSGGGD